MRVLIPLFVLLFIDVTSAASQVTPFKYNIQKTGTGNKAAVVSAHTLASQAGMLMIKKAGNAFDAAIATQLALAVVYPGAGNLGGGGFMIAHLSSGKNIALDYREEAPSHASKDMYLDANGDPVTDLSMEGHLASGVPGTVAGLFSALKFAKLPFKVLAAPAIMLADKGFALTEAQAADFNGSRETFLKLNKYPIAFVKNTAWKAGDILKQPELAATLRRISLKGAAGFYEGPTASLITSAMKSGNGIITRNDLKNYKVKERTSLTFDYKGYQVVTMPLPSSGGIILQQLLMMSAKKNLSTLPVLSPEAVQFMIEAERLAFADRAEYLGDLDFVKVPVKTLLSDQYISDRMKSIIPGKAGSSAVTKAGIIHESEETTHISIIDNEGNAVSVTTTLNNHFGNFTVVKGAGFLMNNEMDDFSVKPGVPNMYGAIGNEKNAIAPGKRMLSSMTPTIVLKNNKPVIVVGTPGGTTIPTSVFQTIVNLIDFKLSPEEAVNKPKFHHQWLPDEVMVERGFPQNTREALIKMGYKITDRSGIGRTELITVSDKGNIKAVADNRGDDDAEVK